jgi:hypothetical protein
MESGKFAVAAKLTGRRQRSGWNFGAGRKAKKEADGYGHGASWKINAGLAGGLGGGA